MRCGDVLTFAQGRRWLAVRIEALGVRRGPAPEAQALYRVMDEPGGGRVKSGDRHSGEAISKQTHS